MGQLTPFAGLFELNPGDTISENGYQFFGNERIEDAYFNAFSTHKHDGHAAVQPFASAATLTTSAIGGTLPAGDTWYVGISAVDIYGGETVVQTASCQLPPAVGDPVSGPVCTGLSDSLGNATAGTYRYAFTLVTASGETLPSPVTNVLVQTNGRVSITVDDSGYSWRLYRSFGYNPLGRLGDTIASATTTLLDDGTRTLYIDQPPPNANFTGATCSIAVASSTTPASATAWRVYASRESDYPSPALWASSAGVVNIPLTTKTITIDSLNNFTDGTPPLVNRTIPGASLILAEDVSYAGNGGLLASGTVESALDSLSGQYVTIGASGSTQLVGSVVLVAGSGVVLTEVQSASSITIGVNLSSVGSGFVLKAGDTMTGPLQMTYPSAGIQIVASAATDGKGVLSLYKASADANPRVWAAYDSSGEGCLHLSDGQSGSLHEAKWYFDNPNFCMHCDGAAAVRSDNGWYAVGGNITAAGNNAQIAATGLGGVFTNEKVNGATTDMYRGRLNGDSQYRWNVTGSGRIGWADGTADLSSPQVSLGTGNLGKDTLIVDSSIAASGGKLVHGRYSVTTTASAQVIASGDIVYVDNSGSAILATLPASPKPGTTLNFKARSNTANNVTLGRNGNNIEGSAADYVMSAGTKEHVVLHFPGDGTGWWIIG